MSLSFRRHRATVTVAPPTVEQRLRDAAAGVYMLLAEAAGDLPEVERIAFFAELVRLSPAVAFIEGPLSSEQALARQRALRAEVTVLGELRGSGSAWTFDAPANSTVRAVA